MQTSALYFQYIFVELTSRQGCDNISDNISRPSTKDVWNSDWPSSNSKCAFLCVEQWEKEPESIFQSQILRYIVVIIGNGKHIHWFGPYFLRFLALESTQKFYFKLIGLAHCIFRSAFLVFLFFVVLNNIVSRNENVFWDSLGLSTSTLSYTSFSQSFLILVKFK